jgi:adenosine deaminase
MNYTQLPKTDLHLLLDTNLSYPLVARLDPAISRVEYEHKFIAPAKCANLADFLTRILSANELMQTAVNLRLVVDDLFDQLAAENVIYAEIRFAPLLHTENGLEAHEVVETVAGVTAAAIRRTGVEARLILCTLRHYTTEQSMVTIKLVEQYHDTAVTRFDIAADEAGFPIDPLYHSGLSIGINTDCRTTSNITLSQEYQKLHDAYNWTTKDINRCNHSALQAAFIDDDTRSNLIEKLARGYKLQNLS